MNDALSLLLLFLIILAVFLSVCILRIPPKRFPHERKSHRFHERRSYGIQSITENGEEVKSLAEKTLADYLRSINVSYYYECSGDRRIRNPDFYLPDFDVYIEYWGLLNADDDYTRRKYARHMKRKMAIYHRYNKRLISIYPENMPNLDWIFRAKFRKVTGFEIPVYNDVEMIGGRGGI
jgi:hypothetical protein